MPRTRASHLRALMEALPKRHVEWIDELVFPEGFEAALAAYRSDAKAAGTSVHRSIKADPALKLHLSGALSTAKPDIRCNRQIP